MKIRHRQSGVELEGDFVRVNGSYFSAPLSIPHGGSCYGASEWEAVPEWVDVTDACTVLDTHRGLQLYHGKEDVLWANGYRLRKVQVKIDGFPKWAFIVERKA